MLMTILLDVVAKENRFPELEFDKRRFYFIGSHNGDNSLAVIMEKATLQLYIIREEDLRWMSKHNELAIVA